MKKLSKGLNTNKTTIANLTRNEMVQFKGRDVSGGGTGAPNTETAAPEDTGS